MNIWGAVYIAKDWHIFVKNYELMHKGNWMILSVGTIIWCKIAIQCCIYDTGKK